MEHSLHESPCHYCTRRGKTFQPASQDPIRRSSKKMAAADCPRQTRSPSTITMVPMGCRRFMIADDGKKIFVQSRIWTPSPEPLRKVRYAHTRTPSTVVIGNVAADQLQNPILEDNKKGTVVRQPLHTLSSDKKHLVAGCARNTKTEGGKKIVLCFPPDSILAEPGKNTSVAACKVKTTVSEARAVSCFEKG